MASTSILNTKSEYRGLILDTANDLDRTISGEIHMGLPAWQAIVTRSQRSYLDEIAFPHFGICPQTQNEGCTFFNCRRRLDLLHVWHFVCAHNGPVELVNDPDWSII